MTTNHPAHGPVSLDRLSLNDAIAHADERAEALFGPCAAQHAQLAAWLRELEERRKADSAEPIYQNYPDVGWSDCSKELYEKLTELGCRTRIVYAAPQPLTDAERAAAGIGVKGD
ncbi:hypothetical protein ACRZJO_002428 [Citrobacter freundii]|nr:hypothetical protein [Citrobacter freundii]HCL6006623.1 hypothetical protein [Citrobacter freundii]